MSQHYDRDPSIDDEYEADYSSEDGSEIIEGEFADQHVEYQRPSDESYHARYEVEDDAISHRSSLDRRGGGLDLTSSTARLVAILALIAFGIAVILWAIRPAADDNMVAGDATAVATADAANSVVPTSTAGPTITVPAEAGSTEEDAEGNETTDTGGEDAPTLAVDGNAVVGGTEGLGVNLRESANTGSAIIQILQDDAPLTIIGGPEEAEGYTWWQVQLEDGTQGWTVQEFLVAQ